MCGLVAIMAPGGAAAHSERLSRMTDAIRHRGPDDSGLLVDGVVGLGFRRLSILDLSPQGHQPMVLADAPVSIVFNGEIYNYLELRQQLQALGHSFRSSGDTEVLLCAYLEWGADCVRRLNGMWAFVIDDRRKGVLFGSRDRFGIKPLFRAVAGDVHLFASEIKALLASQLLPVQADPQTLANFLVDNRLDDGERTFFEGIVNVPAAHCFELNRGGRYRQWRYWSVEAGGAGPSDPAAAFAELFEDAVRVHMRSDVPVAVHLSGGMDSTAIACAAQRVRNVSGASDPLAAFCYMDPNFDERVYINATLEQTGARMTTLGCTPRQLWDSLPEVLRAHDEPFHSMTPLVGYQLMRLTAENGIKVVLNGQGADETLAGYGSYFLNYWHTLLVQGRMRMLWDEVHAWSRERKAQALPVLGRVLRRAAQASMGRIELYRRASRARWRGRLQALDWIDPGLREQSSTPQYAPADLDGALAWSVAHDPLPTYLRVEDRNSSAHSVEARVPFLDHRLVELAFTLQPEWHLRGSANKFILREAMRARIPEIVRARPDKMGFPTAAPQWLRKDLYEPIREVVQDPSFQSAAAIDGRRVARMVEAHRRGERDHLNEVFRSVQWFIWQRGLPRVQAG